MYTKPARFVNLLTNVISIILISVLLATGLLFYPEAQRQVSAASALTYSSVDVMKYTKDTVTNQGADAQIVGIVDAIATNIKPTHIAISVPLDSNADFIANGSRPSPRTVEDFTKKWIDAIHSRGMKVIFRGTWSGIEGIYNFPKRVGWQRFPVGTVHSAATDGNSTWLGKTYGYIIDHPDFFEPGDIWAPMPERTENIFSEPTSFVSYDFPGIQSTYTRFLNDLKAVSTQAFSETDNNGVITGLTANNFTEVNSRWLYQSVFETAGMVVVDHYGSSHTPQEMNADIRRIAAARGKKVFLQEWGDHWNSKLNDSHRSAYLDDMYEVLERLVDDGILVGFNYWGGWINNSEGVIVDLGNNKYGVNWRGQKLAKFFAASKPSAQPDPVIKPTPIPKPTPPPVPSVTHGLKGEYFNDYDFEDFKFTRVDNNINFDWGADRSPSHLIDPDTFSVRWTGFVQPNFTERYTFHTYSDDGIRLWINGQLIIDNWTDHGAMEDLGSINLTTGKKYSIKVEYYENRGGTNAKLFWSSASQSKQIVPFSQLFPN